MSLQSTVGLNLDGSIAKNRALDQQQVAELLMRIPLPNGGLRTSSGPATAIPSPFVDGAVSGELLGAIHGFQAIQSGLLNIDLCVAPGSPTLMAMEALAAAQAIPVPQILATTMLDVAGPIVEEAAPAPISGLPSLVYTVASTEQLVFDDGAVRVTMSFSGLLGASWGKTFGLACTVNPQFLALDRAVQAGDVRRMGATALDMACSELRAQTRVAANGLFAGVSISADAMGTFKVSGSLGDKWRQVSVGFVFPNTIVASGSITITEAVPVPSVGGSVDFSGTMARTIKVMFRDQVAPNDQASALAHLAVLLIAGRVILVPAAAWIARAATIDGARARVRTSAGGLSAERVILGPSP